MTASAPVGASPRFCDLGLPEALTSALRERGITSPFPIQSVTLPDSLAGRDVCGMAPTGSGKTLAFGLAALSRLEAKPAAQRRGPRHPSVLVLVPTRELAAQIETELAPLASAIGARVMSIYGGVGYTKQLAALRRGVDLVIACPGRLADLVGQRSVDLSDVEMVVVDEADRMADMGFLPEVRRLINLTSTARQVLLFSATLGGPVEKLIRDYQHDPVRHDVQSATRAHEVVHHHFWHVPPHERIAVTAQTIGARGPAMVFCRTKRGADRLSERLARSGLQSAAIHGDRSQSQRERALHAFRAGRLDVLVATDVAARGIHVDSVPLVVHFDPPADPTDYVHRAGRTGRAGAAGIVVSLVGQEQVAGTRRIQQELGFPKTISSPNVPGLAVVETSAGATTKRTRSEKGRTGLRFEQPHLESGRGTGAATGRSRRHAVEPRREAADPRETPSSRRPARGSKRRRAPKVVVGTPDRPLRGHTSSS